MRKFQKIKISLLRINTEGDPVVNLCHPEPTCGYCGLKGHSKVRLFLSTVFFLF